MRQSTFLVFLFAVSCTSKVSGETHDLDGEDVYVADAVVAENMPDPEALNAPEEDPSIAEKVANEALDESQNDIEGAEEETEAQVGSDGVLSFTDTVPVKDADDDSKPEEYTETVQPQDDTVDSDKKEALALAGLEANSSSAVTLSEAYEAYEGSSMGKFEPFDGTEIPTTAATFPGCTCTYAETKQRWTCAGTIAHPEKVAGDECCCCTLKCRWKNRCTNEQCEAIGIDQAEEVAEEEKRMRELMKGADMLISDDLPGFVVDMGKGRCDQNRIIAACKAKGLTPLCDHTSYARGGCYSPGLKGTKFFNRHFSHWGSHRSYFGIEDDYIFEGMCFYANNPNGLAPCNGDSHCWTNGNHRLSPNARVLATGKVPNIHFNDISSCNGGLGCWRTICVRNAPNNLR